MSSVLVPLVCMALLAAFIGAIVYPILTTRHAWRRATGSDRARLELTERKEQVYASIKELEFDHSLGKVGTDDYESLRAGLETEAVEVLRRLDGLDGHAGGGDSGDSDNLDARIEADIAARRTAPVAPLQPASASSSTTAPSRPAPTPHAFCHACGQPRTSEHKFCPHCGQAFAAPPAN